MSSLRSSTTEDGTVAFDLQAARTSILNVCAIAGTIAARSRTAPTEQESNAITQPVKELLRRVVDVAVTAGINLYAACIAKLEMNEAKYPSELCSATVSQQTNVPPHWLIT
jgi:negative regulator of sigma E activity